MRLMFARAFTVALAVLGGAGAMAFPKLILDDAVPEPESERPAFASPAAPPARVVRLAPQVPTSPLRRPAPPSRRTPAPIRADASRGAILISNSRPTPAPAKHRAPAPPRPAARPAATPTRTPAPTAVPRSAPSVPPSAAVPAPPPAQPPVPAAAPAPAAPAAAEPSQPAREPAVRTLASADEEPTTSVDHAQPASTVSNAHPSPPRGRPFHGDAAVPPKKNEDKHEDEHKHEDEEDDGEHH